MIYILFSYLLHTIICLVRIYVLFTSVTSRLSSKRHYSNFLLNDLLGQNVTSGSFLYLSAIK